MGFLADGTERHGSGHEVLYDVFHRFHFLYGDGIFPESEKVSQENRRVLFIGQTCEFLEFPVAACPCGELQGADGFRIPCMLFSVFPVRELPDMRKDSERSGRFESAVVESDAVGGYFLETYSSYCGDRGMEICPEQILSQADGFEYLRSAVGPDGAYAHLAHDFVQTFADGLDVVFLCSFVVHLYPSRLHETVQYGECHVRVDGAGSIAHQQCGMHHFAYFSAFHYKGCLYPFLD